ncbi:MAG: sporulation integral membrane protein YtvI [Clostridia bacterium]|nr:sporulation integral membrane protein YtvI [Clostridia bacterium]
MVIDMGYFAKVIKKILILLITLIAIFLSFKLALFYLPFLIGFIISLLIEPIIKLVNKKTKLARKTSSIIVLLCIFTILIILITWGVISLITEASNLLQGLNTYIEKIYTQIQNYINNINFDKIEIPTQVISIIQTSTNNFLDFITKWISDFLTSILQGITSIPIIGIYIVITILSTYFICADKLYILDQLEHHFPKLWVRKFGIHLKKLISTLGSYLKAEATLILISFIEVLIGLYVFKWLGLNVGYPLLVALGIGFVDALPILGAGTVMIPWSIISAINGDIKLGIALFSLYVIILVVHQLLEPKIVSGNIGIHPIFTLIAMYTGFRLSGILGLFIGPIVLIILQNVFETMIDNGIVKTILNRG